MKNFMRISALLMVLTLPIHESIAEQQYGFSADSFSNAKKIAATAGIVFGIGFTAYQRHRAKQFIQSEKNNKNVDRSHTLKTIYATLGSVTSATKDHSFFPWQVQTSKFIVCKNGSEDEIHVLTPQFGPLVGSLPKALFTVGAFALIGSQMLRSPGK
ncbi:MAG TPA: hypothetical protein VHO47_04575 [Candidatus Babeliales bacterium]|nr:hypothetical protein [Candidatus Babeliales bacterium]